MYCINIQSTHVYYIRNSSLLQFSLNILLTLPYKRRSQSQIQEKNLECASTYITSQMITLAFLLNFTEIYSFKLFDIYLKVSKTTRRLQQTYLFVESLISDWNTSCVLLNYPPNSDWSFNQYHLIKLFFCY